jgi:hypothetical protein
MLLAVHCKGRGSAKRCIHHKYESADKACWCLESQFYITPSLYVYCITPSNSNTSLFSICT